MESFSITIIIPVYNRLETTKVGLSNLFALLGKIAESDRKVKLDVVVVDDNSNDGTYEWIKDHMPQVHLLKGTGDLWWSGGINKGAQYALENLKTDYILLWNDDVHANENYFGELLDIVTTQAVDIVGSMALFEENGIKVHSFGGFFNATNGKKGVHYFKKEADSIAEDMKVVDWLPGMGTCIHRDVIDKIGYWDEKRFPQYFGDSDYTLRATEAGIPVYVSKRLVIFNDISTTGLNKRVSSWKELRTALTSIRSVYEFRRDFMFYRIHGRGLMSFYGLFLKYFFYLGGFLKWKVKGVMK